jgi:hypothetical protein
LQMCERYRTLSLGGADYDEMIKLNSGAWAFWTTTKHSVSEQYAIMSAIMRGGTPAIMNFKIDGPRLRKLLTARLAGEDPYDEGFCFLPPSFGIINALLTNCSVEIVTSETMDFG